MPRAAKHIFVRVTVFYLLSLFIVGLIVPSNDPKLLASTGNAASSPFIIAAENAGVKVLPSIVNAVIITSAWSSGNHGILQGSRSLYALALESKAPKVFRRVTRFGIPWVAVCFQSLFMLLAFMRSIPTPTLYLAGCKILPPHPPSRSGSLSVSALSAFDKP